jgi:hypothetical protein
MDEDERAKSRSISDTWTSSCQSKKSKTDWLGFNHVNCQLLYRTVRTTVLRTYGVGVLKIESLCRPTYTQYKYDVYFMTK